MAVVRRRARDLADAAAPLSSDQALMLVSLFARYPQPAARRAGGDTP